MEQADKIKSVGTEQVWPPSLTRLTDKCRRCTKPPQEARASNTPRYKDRLMSHGKAKSLQTSEDWELQ